MRSESCVQCINNSFRQRSSFFSGNIKWLPLAIFIMTNANASHSMFSEGIRRFPVAFDVLLQRLFTEPYQKNDNYIPARIYVFISLRGLLIKQRPSRRLFCIQSLRASFPARNRFRFHNFNNSHDSNSNSKTLEILSYGLKKIIYIRKYQCSFFKVFNFCIVNY